MRTGSVSEEVRTMMMRSEHQGGPTACANFIIDITSHSSYTTTGEIDATEQI
jgi:hypothetical protein